MLLKVTGQRPWAPIRRQQQRVVGTAGTSAWLLTQLHASLLPSSRQPLPPPAPPPGWPGPPTSPASAVCASVTVAPGAIASVALNSAAAMLVATALSVVASSAAFTSTGTTTNAAVVAIEVQGSARDMSDSPDVTAAWRGSLSAGCFGSGNAASGSSSSKANPHVHLAAPSMSSSRADWPASGGASALQKTCIEKDRSCISSSDGVSDTRR
mmetsp:Transcript_102639/g.331184  ORF Transcript_102639/g.331184 Transcript_102639/m.331184 type:complete len:211 (-) Transcript_102639:93-725(-)